MEVVQKLVETRDQQSPEFQALVENSLQVIDRAFTMFK